MFLLKTKLFNYHIYTFKQLTMNTPVMLSLRKDTKKLSDTNEHTFDLPDGKPHSYESISKGHNCCKN